MNPNILLGGSMQNTFRYTGGNGDISPKITKGLPLFLSPRYINFTQPVNFPSTGEKIIVWTNQSFNAQAPTISVFDRLVMNTAGIDNPTWRLFDNQTGRFLSNWGVPTPLMFGTAGRPYILPEPIIMDANSDVQATANPVFQTGAKNRYPYFHGRQFYYDNAKRNRLLERKRYISPFLLLPEADVTLTSGQTLKYTVKIAQGHFRALQLQLYGDLAFTVRITDVLRRQEISNTAIVHGGASANPELIGRYPRWLACPYLLPQGSTLTFELTNLGAADNQIGVALAGQMLYCPLREVQTMLRDLAKPFTLDVGVAD